MTILVDVDDTIEYFLPAWVDAINKTYGTSVRAEDVDDWDTTKFFEGLTRENLWDAIADESFWKTVKPREDAKIWLKKLVDDGHDVYLLTASGARSIKPKFDYIVNTHFPYIPWNKVIVCSNKQMVKGDVLVDDAPHNLVGGEYEKILLSTTVNKGFDERSIGATRCDNWEQVYKFINELDRIYWKPPEVKKS